MANDRMWLKCKECDGRFFLSKHLGSGWYESSNPETFGQNFDNFLEDHRECFFKNQQNFEIDYEVKLRSEEQNGKVGDGSF